MPHLVAVSMPGGWEIIFLAVLALLIFGPDKLPGMARSVGRTISSFRSEATTVIEELKRSADLNEVREVADELRATGDQLSGELRTTESEVRRSAALAGGSAHAARRRDGHRPGADGESHDPHAEVSEGAAVAVEDLGPPPFDPEAT